jgi:anti-sigma B factor antagonist
MNALDFNVHLTVCDGWPMVVVQGELDMATTARFRDAIEQASEWDERRVVIDMSGVTFMDSSGLLQLCRLTGRGVPIELRDLQPEPRRVLELTGTDVMFTLTASADVVR